MGEQVDDAMTVVVRDDKGWERIDDEDNTDSRFRQKFHYLGTHFWFTYF